jgi:hypothetical protein
VESVVQLLPLDGTRGNQDFADFHFLFSHLSSPVGNMGE